jgi:hydrogenase-4 component F
MFFLSGNILMKYRSRSLDVVKGLLQAAPITSVFLLGGVFALVGAPPFNIFLSKFMIISAGIASGHLWLMLVCLLFVMVAFTALFKMLSSVVLGEKPENVTKGETGFTTLAPILILMVLILALGVTMPAPLGALLQGATQVVTTGTSVTQSGGPSLAAHSILPAFGLPQAQQFIGLIGIQSGK